MQENPLFLPGEERMRNVSMAQLVPLFQELLAAGKSVRFAPRGDSMRPMLRPGLDSVVLSPPPEQLRKYDLPLYRRDDGHYILHRVIEAGEVCTCIGDNQFCPEPGVRRDQIVGVVTGFRRGGRDYSVTHPGYQLYCRFWHYSRSVRRFMRRVRSWLRRHIR